MVPEMDQRIQCPSIPRQKYLPCDRVGSWTFAWLPVVTGVVAPVHDGHFETLVSDHHVHFLPACHIWVAPFAYHAWVAPFAYHPRVAPFVYHAWVALFAYHPWVALFAYHPWVAPFVYHPRVAPFAYHACVYDLISADHPPVAPFVYHPLVVPCAGHQTPFRFYGQKTTFHRYDWQRAAP